MGRRTTPPRHCQPHIRAPSLPLLVLLAVSVLHSPLLSYSPIVLTASAAPFSVFDDYISPCTPISDPPPAGFRLWSSASTWGLSGGAIPGVGSAAGSNATIPCDTAVLLDVPSVRLHTLTIRGMLKLKDDPSLPVIAVNASFVIVEGQLMVGSPASHFSQQAAFTLLPNPNGRLGYQYTANAPADTAHPRSLGHKAFAIVGGQVSLHGMPGGSSTPAWCQLSQSASAGDLSLVLDCNAAQWPPGAYIALASTDYYMDAVDVVKIKTVSVSNGKTTITIHHPLQYNHFGSFISDGFGGWLDERGEVALLNRSISISGLHEAGEHSWEGGHFIVFMTQRAQAIEGVEFAQMGQQGVLGRYNIHFHLCGDQQGKSVVRKNVMHDSKQRCVVVHMTNGLLLEDNVAFHTRGHCFMLEEGGETNNTFRHNLGMWQMPVDVKIPSPVDPSKSDETDDTPATFWITNPNNHLIGNHAGGSDDSGFWFELRESVRGLSLLNSRLKDTVPQSYPVLGTLSGNVGHSSYAGFRVYPNGYFPRFNATVSGDDDWWDDPVPVTFTGFFLYKNLGPGMFLHNTDSTTFSGFAVADNIMGVELYHCEGVTVDHLTAVGLSSNRGNPYDCDAAEGYGCAPANGCKYPLADPTGGRSVGWGGKSEHIYGVVFSPSAYFLDGNLANVLHSSKFSGFDASCRVQAAVAYGDDAGTYVNVGHTVRSLSFAPGTNRLFFAPRFEKDLYDDPGSPPVDHGDSARVYALRDTDGSLSGTGSPSFLVAATPFMLPPASASASSSAGQCTALPAAAAGSVASCPTACYRTVQVSYYEHVPAVSEDYMRKQGSLSSVTFTRLADGAVQQTTGPLLDLDPTPDSQPFLMKFAAPLLAGYSYELLLSPPQASTFVPRNLTIQFADGGAAVCSQPVTIRLRPIQGRQWQVFASDGNSMPDPCSGWQPSSSQPSVPGVTYRYVCAGRPRRQHLQLTAITSVPTIGLSPLTIVRAMAVPKPCTATTLCGLLPTTATWRYDQSGKNLYRSSFFSPTYSDASWPSGAAPLAYEGWDWPLINTPLKQPSDGLQTFFFRSSFTLTRPTCYTHLILNLLVNDGVVLYLNGRELKRFNMPRGPLGSAVQPLSDRDIEPDDDSFMKYSRAVVPLAASIARLRDGTNTIAAALHVNMEDGWDAAWALRVSAYSPRNCGV